MIYTIESGTRVIALVNDRESIHKFRDCTIRWSNPTERIQFRQLEAKYKQRRWFRDKVDAALWWVWCVSFPMYYRNDGV